MNTVFEVVVRSTEIDVNGHVNNAKYMEYLEWAREDWYEQHSLDYSTLKSQDFVTVVVHADLSYRREAFQNDRLVISTHLTKVGNTSFSMQQTIDNQHRDRVMDAMFVIVTVSSTARTKVTVPAAIRALVERNPPPRT